MSSTALGMLLGQILAPIVVIGIGYLVARSMNHNREFGDQVRWPIYVGVGLGLVTLVSQCSNPTAHPPVEQKVIIETQQGAETEPFPAASDFAAEDLDAYAQMVVDEVKSRRGDPAIDYRGTSIAFDGDAGTIVRSSFYLNDVLVNRMYVSSLEGRLTLVTCYNSDDSQLNPNVLSQCRAEAVSELGNFSEGGPYG